MARKHRPDKTQNRQTTETQRPNEEYTMPETNDAGDAISEEALRDASGAATGGADDLPTKVERSTEQTVRKRHPINQGSSAYMGGGADSGTDL